MKTVLTSPCKRGALLHDGLYKVGMIQKITSCATAFTAVNSFIVYQTDSESWFGSITATTNDIPTMVCSQLMIYLLWYARN